MSKKQLVQEINYYKRNIIIFLPFTNKIFSSNTKVPLLRYLPSKPVFASVLKKRSVDQLSNGSRCDPERKVMSAFLPHKKDKTILRADLPEPGDGAEFFGIHNFCHHIQVFVQFTVEQPFAVTPFGSLRGLLTCVE